MEAVVKILDNCCHCWSMKVKRKEILLSLGAVTSRNPDELGKLCGQKKCKLAWPEDKQISQNDAADLVAFLSYSVSVSQLVCWRKWVIFLVDLKNQPEKGTAFVCTVWDSVHLRRYEFMLYM